MLSLLLSTLNTASQEIDRVRNEVLSIDPGKIVKSPRLRDQSARIISASYIWLSATLEKYFRTTLESIFSEINSKQILFSELRPSLLSIACTADLMSLRDIKNYQKNWARRVAMFSKQHSEDVVFLQFSEIPYDGKTIRAEHFEVVWSVLGIDGLSIPTPIHKLTLTDLADGRNKIAHGEVDPITFGRNKNRNDLLSTMNRLEDMIIHFTDSACDYLTNKTYFKVGP